MSLRTLLEFNHDYAALGRDGLQEALQLYLNSASREHAEALEVYGIRVIGMRHHSGNFIVEGTPDGFPVRHLVRPKAGRAEQSALPRETNQ